MLYPSLAVVPVFDIPYDRGIFSDIYLNKSDKNFPQESGTNTIIYYRKIKSEK